MKNSTKNGSSEMMIESGSDFSLVYRQWFGHQLWPALCTSYVWALPSAYPLLVHQWWGGSHPGEVVSEIWVKSGEEWWRVEPTLHLVIRPVYRGLRGMGEEWRVFHDSIVYSNLEIRNPREMVLCSYLLWQVLLCYMDSQLADMETVGCSR
mgnify:CR=1 FL=1